MSMKITIRPFKTKNPDAGVRYTHVLQFPELPALVKKHAGGDVKQAEMGECIQPTVGINLTGNPPMEFNWTNGEVHIEPDSRHRTLNCKLTFHGLKEAMRAAAIGIRVTKKPLKMRLMLQPYAGQNGRLLLISGVPNVTGRP